jgi:hypothetical protein
MSIQLQRLAFLRCPLPEFEGQVSEIECCVHLVDRGVVIGADQD